MDIQFLNRLCTVYFISMCFRESNRQTDERINEVFVSAGLSNVSVMIVKVHVSVHQTNAWTISFTRRVNTVHSIAWPVSGEMLIKLNITVSTQLLLSLLKMYKSQIYDNVLSYINDIFWTHFILSVFIHCYNACTYLFLHRTYIWKYHPVINYCSYIYNY